MVIGAELVKQIVNICNKKASRLKDDKDFKLESHMGFSLNN
jgi:hypothetical protein